MCDKPLYKPTTQHSTLHNAMSKPNGLEINEKMAHAIPQGDGGNITLQNGYVLANGSEILAEIIPQLRKTESTLPPAVRLWLRFPTGDFMMLIKRMDVPIPDKDILSWDWFHNATAEGKQAEALASVTNVLIQDNPDRDSSVQFVCELDLSSISNAAGKHTNKHPTSVSGMHLVGFFVPHSGRNAFDPPDLTDCDGEASTEVDSAHIPAQMQAHLPE